LAFFKFLSFGF
jgi:hypothetical protein